MLGAMVNALGALFGGLIGLVAGKGINEKLTDRIFQALALFVIYVGISGAIGGQNTLVVLLSLAFGTLIGELADLDRLLKKFGDWIEGKIKKRKNGEDTGKETTDAGAVGQAETVSFAEAFVTTSLLECVGAYVLVGALAAGLKGDNSMLFSKAGLDFVGSIVLAAGMGAGVVFAALPLFIVTATIVLLAQLLAPLLSDAVIADMVCVGSLIIIGQAMNMLKVTELKIMNFVPAMFLPILFVPLYDMIAGIF